MMVENYNNIKVSCFQNNITIIWFRKKDFLIEKQIARTAICAISECLSSHLIFYATHIINPFLNSRISANHDKRE